MIMAFPEDFKDLIPLDQGGPGQGQRIDGFGGNPREDQSVHRAEVQSVGKAPVILLHGNAASQDPLNKWNLLFLKQMLMGKGYPEELIWAPSYLGSRGQFDPQLLTSPPSPHTNNVNEVREFIDNVCEYLDVEVVDFIAHSLGCTLAYAVFRGLKKQRTPVVFEDRLKRWHRVGTFVALAGAFHGLRPLISLPFPPPGEWEPDGEFMSGLLAENLGGGGETPFQEGSSRTPGPRPHFIKYFCGVARGDFIDDQSPLGRRTGFLEGAINEPFYEGVSNFPPGDDGHQKIKEDPEVLNMFLPLLNSVPPVSPVTLTLDKDSGNYDSPLTLTPNIDQPDKTVTFVATKIVTGLVAGTVVTSGAGKAVGTLNDGEPLTLSTDGVWEVVFSTDGTEDLKKTYRVGLPALEVGISTDNSTPFEGSLDVAATTTRGNLYHSFNGDPVGWKEGDVVTINRDAVVYFIAIDPEGNASEIVSKSFERVDTLG
jgi:Lipase (class 2)